MKKNRIGILFLAYTVILLGGCSSDEPNEKMLAKIEKITFDGADAFSYKYDNEGRVIYCADNMLGQSFQISYNPLKITVKYNGTDPTDDSYTEIYDIVLNDRNFISTFKAKFEAESTDAESIPETEGYALYDTNGRLLELKGFVGLDFKLEWDSEGRLLSSSNPAYTTTYNSSTQENVSGQWLPVWYLCGGLEMTGLIGNPPAYLISHGKEQFLDGTVSVADFSYNFGAGNLVDIILFKADGNESIPLSVFYKK